MTKKTTRPVKIHQKIRRIVVEVEHDNGEVAVLELTDIRQPMEMDLQPHSKETAFGAELTHYSLNMAAKVGQMRLSWEPKVH